MFSPRLSRCLNPKVRAPAQHISQPRPTPAFPQRYTDRYTAYLEMDAAYPEFKLGPPRRARYRKGVILLYERPRRQINDWGSRRVVRARAILRWGATQCRLDSQRRGGRG